MPISDIWARWLVTAMSSRLAQGWLPLRSAAWIGKEKLKAEAEKDSEDEQGEPEGETEAAGA